MKKYIALLLLSPVLAFAQDAANFSEIKGEFLAKGKSIVTYEISIHEGESLLFKSDFAVMNGEQMTFFKREVTKERAASDAKKLSSGKNSLAQEIEELQEKSAEMEIFKIKSDIGKNPKNIISHFTILNVSVAGTKKQSLKESIVEDVPNGAFMNETPVLESGKNEFSLTHLKDKDISFTRDEKTYQIKANY